MDETNDQKLRSDGAAAPAPITSESVDIENALPASAWKMPEPVFKKTSGYLPKGFEKRVEDDWAIDQAPLPAVPEAQAPAHDIQPQPEITLDNIPVEELQSAMPAKTERSRGMTVFLFLLGIVAMIGVAIAVVAVILYLYYSPEQISVFN